MENKYHLLYILLTVAAYFIGRYEGIVTEGATWFRAALEEKPIIKAGCALKVKFIEGIVCEEGSNESK